MQNIKNISTGFLVSFLGSIPLGYLNVIGFKVFQKSGIQPTIYYLLGVICTEFFVIYFTLNFAKKLGENKNITKYIEGFSVLFMYVLAAVFYFGSNAKTNDTSSFNYPPFFLGIVLSGLNFVQIPFWTGWNLYLLNGNYIEVSKSRKYIYIIGTVAGTFCGMFALIVSLIYFTSHLDFVTEYLMQIIIPFVFLGLGIFQTITFYRKHFN
jgi:hypothetical protein